MRVPQVMRAYHGHPSLSECWPPDLIAEPVARDVTIGVADSWRARIGDAPNARLGAACLETPVEVARLEGRTGDLEAPGWPCRSGPAQLLPSRGGSTRRGWSRSPGRGPACCASRVLAETASDRKSTRLNSSH